MNFFTKLFRSRDKPMNHLGGLSFLFGQTAAGKAVNEWTAMQTTEGAVFASAPNPVAGIASCLCLQRAGKRAHVGHPLYFLLHDLPNPEMMSFIIRETLMVHFLLK